MQSSHEHSNVALALIQQVKNYASIKVRNENRIHPPVPFFHSFVMQNWGNENLHQGKIATHFSLIQMIKESEEGWKSSENSFHREKSSSFQLFKSQFSSN